MFIKYAKAGQKYFSKYPSFNSWTHAIGGIGIGILIARPFAVDHPVRWAVVFVAIALGMHLYAMTQKTK